MSVQNCIGILCLKKFALRFVVNRASITNLYAVVDVIPGLKMIVFILFLIWFYILLLYGSFFSVSLSTAAPSGMSWNCFSKELRKAAML